MFRPYPFLLLLLVTGAPRAAAQLPDPRLVRIDSLHDAIQPAAALAEAQAVLATEPGNYGALWRAARSQVDVARQIKGEHDYTKKVRDSVYAAAESYALRAVAADSSDAEGHFVLGLALGQLSRTRGGKERVKFARTIYDEAARALALDTAHDGAHHVLGAWHAEIMRLSGVAKFFAKTLLGAGFMDRAAWDSAAAHLERSAAIEPDFIQHRLDLAEIYVDMKRWDDAEAQLRAIPALPDRDVLDDDYRAAAAALLTRIQRERRS